MNTAFPIYVMVDGTRMGPLTRRELSAHLAAGGIKPSDLAFDVSTSKWVPLKNLVEIEVLKREGITTVAPRGPRLAGRRRRIAAGLVDLFLMGLISALVGGVFYALTTVIGAKFIEDKAVGIPRLIAIGSIGAYILGTVGALAGQTWLLVRTGQTLGKKLLGVRVVGLHGERPKLAALLLRTYVPPLIYFVPMVGVIWMMVSVAFLCGSTRRTLHDRMAKTCVLVA